MRLPVLRKGTRDVEPLPERPDIRFRDGSRVAELVALQQRVDTLIEEALAGVDGLVPWSAAGWRPAADVRETDDDYVVEIDVPAARREDISVDVSPRELVVTGEVKERQGLFRTRTRRTGRFEYRLAVPADVDPDQTRADLSSGVLTVRLPKTQEARRRRIPVTS